MTRTVKRTLSLVLALVMICSTLGIMTFAQERAVVLECYWCEDSERFAYSHAGEQFNRIVECPTHGGHDAEEWYVGQYYRCLDCGGLVFTRTSTKYICLD